MSIIKKDFSFMEFPLSILRQDAFPLDKNSVFYSLSDAQSYASNNPTAYVGQPIAVVDESSEKVRCYVVSFNGELKGVGSVEDLPLASGSADGLLSKENWQKLFDLDNMLEQKLDKNANAVSATKLETARNINGHLFDGTSDINITSDDIIEGSTNKFVTLEEKARWNNTYTKSETYTKTEVDEKVKNLVSGLTWRGSFETLSDLNSVEDPQDGWFAIVINEPSLLSKNVLFVYESAEPAGWKQLGDMLMPGLVSEETAGLMTAEIYKQHLKYGLDITDIKGILEGYKTGIGLPISTNSSIGLVKIGENINVTPDGTISVAEPYEHPETHDASMIVQDETHRMVKDSQINTWTNDTYRKNEVYAKAEVYNKSETDSKIQNAVDEATQTATEEDILALFS